MVYQITRWLMRRLDAPAAANPSYELEQLCPLSVQTFPLFAVRGYGLALSLGGMRASRMGTTQASLGISYTTKSASNCQ